MLTSIWKCCTATFPRSLDTNLLVQCKINCTFRISRQVLNEFRAYLSNILLHLLAACL
jgi:hypothetical protein